MGVIRAKFTGRSYWSVRFTDGRIISEWDDDPGSPNRHADWPRIPYKGRQAIRLYCPNGQVAHLGDTIDATGRIVQLKIGLSTAGQGRGVLAHFIGLIEGTDGQGKFYSWERTEDGGGHLIQFSDNVNDMAYHNIGKLNADALGLNMG